MFNRDRGNLHETVDHVDKIHSLDDFKRFINFFISREAYGFGVGRITIRAERVLDLLDIIENNAFELDRKKDAWEELVRELPPVLANKLRDFLPDPGTRTRTKTKTYGSP